MTHSPGERVEVTMSEFGVVSYRRGTAVDFPTEEYARVLCDFQPTAHVYPRDAVHSIREAVQGHISHLLAALGEVTEADRFAVELDLQRLAPLGGLIGHAQRTKANVSRLASDWAEERAL